MVTRPDRRAHADVLLEPGDPARLGRLGNALRAAGDAVAAAKTYRRGLLINARLAPLLGALGNALADQGHLREARRQMLRAMKADPDIEQVYGALAVLARRGGDSAGAVDAFRLGLLQRPASMPLSIHHGNALSALDRHAEALRSFRRAWILAPGGTAAANNIARAASELHRNKEGRDWFRRAAILSPDLDAPLKSIGNEFKLLADAETGYTWLTRAVVLAPGNFDAVSDLLFAASYLVGTTAFKLRALHERHCATMGPAAPLPVRAVGTRLKVGFASADFSVHPVGQFILGLFEHHDPREIQLHCLSDTLRHDAVTHRLRARADGWDDTASLDHAAWLDLARSKDFTVLIDLAGHTQGNRLPAFARRAAATQGSWAGYIGTTGVAAVDFVLSDRFQTPLEEDGAYSERVLRMPNGYISYMPTDLPPQEGPKPSNAGRMTFASFNNPAKINRPLVDLWSSILRRVPDSRLLLKYRGFDDPDLGQKLAGWFAGNGIALNRLMLEGRAPRPVMLARYRDVDLALDTAPYSGGATTCEALAMGVPVVTYPGATFASRHSVSHLTNAGMPELVQADAAAYADLAVDLALNPAKLEATRSALAARLPASPHRDHAGFARDFTRVLTDLVNGRN
jgi:protein O-GlcNAc transferase